MWDLFLSSWAGMQIGWILGITTVSGKGSFGPRCWMGNHNGMWVLTQLLKEGRKTLKCREHVALGWRRDSRASQGEYGLLVDGSETHQGSDQDSPLCLHLPFLFPSTPIFPGVKVPHDHSPNSYSSTQPSFCHAYRIPPLFACWRQCSMAVVNLLFG